MKKITALLLIAIVLSFGLKAQTFIPIHNYQQPDGLVLEKVFGIPYGSDTTFNGVNPVIGGVASKPPGFLFYRTTDSVLYVWAGTRWIPAGGGSGGSGLGRRDTVYVKDDLYVTYDALGHQVIGRYHNPGIESGGIITSSGCLTLHVGPISVYFTDGKHIISNAIDLTVPTPHASLPRTDRIVVDTLGQVSIIQGTAATIPQDPPYNLASQISVATYPVAGGATCLNINSIIIYDETGGSEYTPSTNGTITSDDNDAANPEHGTVAFRVTSYEDGSKMIFDKPSGQDTVFSNSVFRFGYYLNNPLGSKQIQMQLFHLGVATTSSIILNPYISTSDTLEYQTVAVPRYAFGGTGNLLVDSIVFNLAGYDTSGASGFFFDYFQLQTGISNGPTNPQILQTLQETFNTEIGGSLLTKHDTVLIKDNAYLMFLGTQSRYQFQNGQYDFFLDDGTGNTTQIVGSSGNASINTSNISGLSSSVVLTGGTARIHAQSSTPESNIDAFADSVVISNAPFITSSTYWKLHGDSHFIESIADSIVNDAALGVYKFTNVPVASGTSDSALVIDRATGNMKMQEISAGGGGGTPGIDDVLSVGQNFGSDHTMDLNGNQFLISSGAFNFLEATPSTYKSKLNSSDGTGNSYLEVQSNTGTSQVHFDLLSADGTGAQSEIIGEPVTKKLTMSVENGAGAGGILIFNADGAGNLTNFDLNSFNATNSVEIFGSADDGKITYTALRHFFATPNYPAGVLDIQDGGTGNLIVSIGDADGAVNGTQEIINDNGQTITSTANNGNIFNGKMVLNTVASGASTDSILTINTSNGEVRKITVGNLVSNHTVYNETFTGSTSTTLTLSHNYVSGTIRVFKNGARLDDADFTEATANTITLGVARLSGDVFILDFNY